MEAYYYCHILNLGACSDKSDPTLLPDPFRHSSLMALNLPLCISSARQKIISPVERVIAQSLSILTIKILVSRKDTVGLPLKQVS